MPNRRHAWRDPPATLRDSLLLLNDHQASDLWLTDMLAAADLQRAWNAATTAQRAHFSAECVYYAQNRWVRGRRPSEAVLCSALQTGGVSPLAE